MRVEAYYDVLYKVSCGVMELGVNSVTVQRGEVCWAGLFIGTQVTRQAWLPDAIRASLRDLRTNLSGPDVILQSSEDYPFGSDVSYQSNCPWLPACAVFGAEVGEASP